MNQTTQENTLVEKEASDSTFSRETRSRRSSHRRKRTVELYSLDQLTFESFYHTDMNLLDAKIIETRSKMFGTTLFVVEIKISNIPPFTVPRRYNQFNAFHTALKERFNNVKWPDFPGKYQIMKKNEARKNAFNLLLEKVIELIRMKETPRKVLLILFYRFFLDTEAAQRQKAETPGKKNNDGKGRSNSEADEEDEGESKKLVEDLKNAVSDFESKFNNLENGDRVDTQENDDNESGRMSGRSVTEGGSLEENKSALYGSPKKNDPDFISGDGKEYIIDEDGKNEYNRSDSIYGDPFVDPESPDRDRRKHLISSVLEMESDELTSLKDGEAKTEILDNEPSPDDQDKLMRSMTVDENKLGENNNQKLEGTPSGLSTQPSTNKKDDKNSQIKETNNQSKFGGKWGSGLEILKNNVSKYMNKKGKTASSGNIPLPTNQTNQTTTLSVLQPSSNPNIQESPNVDDKVSEKNSPEEPAIMDQNTPNESRERANALERPIVIEKKDMSKFLNTEVYGFAGTIHMKLSSEKKWARYYTKVAECFILLHRSVLDNYPVHIIAIYAATINHVKTEDGREYLELFHYFDNEKVEICIDPTIEEQNDPQDPHRNLMVWQNQIKIATQKTTGLQLNQIKYNPIGKCQLIISEANGVKGLPNNSTCYVRVGHIPYYLKTTQALARETMELKQIFFLPLCDPFFSVTLDIVAVFNDGWIKEHQKEEIICTGEISVPDILRLGKGEVLTLHLALKYTETRRKMVAKALNLNEGDVPEPTLKIKLKNLSSFKSLFAPSTRDYFEGIKLDKENYSKQYFKLGFRRIYRIVAQVKIFKNQISDIFNFKYPLFSTLCFFLLTTFIILFDVSTVLPDFMFLLVLIALYKSPPMNKYVLPYLEEWFFGDSHLNPYYQNPCVTTAGDQDIKKSMNTSKWKEKFRNEESLVTTFKKAKKSLATMTIVLNSVSSFFEKFKNILSWEDPTRTACFIAFLMFAYCALYAIGLRTMILLAVWASFAKGVSYYKIVYPKNKELARVTLNFIVKRYFPEHSAAISTNLTLPWPHTVNFNSFQRKLLEQFLYRLSIILPEDALVTYKTPEELTTAIATCPRVLTFFKEPAEEAMIENSARKEPKFSIANIIYFLLNVPSDYYRVIHPRLTQ